MFLKRKIKKNDFFSVLALSVSHCSTAYFRFLALPFSPNRRKSVKGRTLGKTGSFAVLPKPLTLGEVALRSNDGEGKAADNQILPRSDTELVSATVPSGDEPDSWKTIISQKGYEVQTVLKGLGEYESIRHIFVEHAKAAK